MMGSVVDLADMRGPGGGLEEDGSAAEEEAIVYAQWMEWGITFVVLLMLRLEIWEGREVHVAPSALGI